MGWTLAQLDALPEDERADWLAYELRRQRRLTDLLHQMKRQADGGTPVDGGAYAAVWLALE